MEHSFLYLPINRFLTALFRPPPVGKLSPGRPDYLFPDRTGSWLQDNGILSLSLRLAGNIGGEHIATGVFFTMAPILVPWPMMALGLIGALLQAFIFVILSTIYIAGAVAHEEH